MPIWALTQERVDKLNQQIKKKKEEHDTLNDQSEKDLWCKDLDAFMEEWLAQLENDAQMQDGIRKRGRRASRKIGTGQLRKAEGEDEDEDDDDDNYIPTQKPANTQRKGPKAPTQASTPAGKGSKMGGTKVPAAGYESVSDNEIVTATSMRKTTSASSSKPQIHSRHDQSGNVGGIMSDELDQHARTTVRNSQATHSGE